MQRNNQYLLREMERLETISEILDRRNIAYSYKALKLEVTESNRYISQKLKVPIASGIVHLRRLLLIGGLPRAIERSYALYHRVEGIEKEDPENPRLYRRLLEWDGVPAKWSREEILVVEAGQEEKELLECEDNELMMIKGITYKEETEPFVYFETVAVSDLYEFRRINRL